MTNKDPFTVLGISRNASPEDIQKAYRNKAKQYHPDRNIGDPQAEEKFREVQEAYDALTNPKKNSNFNNPFAHGFDPFSGFMNDIFGNTIHKGRNIQAKVQLTLEEVATGCIKNITIQKNKICNSCKGSGSIKSDKCNYCNGNGIQNVKMQGASILNFQTTCQACKGSGRITIDKCLDCNGNGYESTQESVILDIPIPAGISTGQMRMPEKGDPCKYNGGVNGDLILFVQVLNHELYQRHDNHLIVEIPCTFFQLLSGFTVEIPTIYKQKVLVKIPKNAIPNNHIRVQKQGLPGGIEGIGDMFIVPKLDMPKNMPEEYYNILEKANEIEIKNPSIRRKEWERKIGKYL